MRPVNLLPARYRPARASGERPGIGYAAIAALAVLLLMVVLYVVTQNGINDAKDATAEAQAEQQAAQAKVGELQAFGDFAAIKTARESAVKNIALTRFDYERLMREVALVLPHNTYLTSLSSTNAGGSTSTTTSTPTTTTETGATGAAAGPTITVAGCAPSHPSVATAMVRLRQLHNVSDVNLTSSTKQQPQATGNVCRVLWNAVLVFESEAPATTTGRVPARLGGGQ